MLVSPSYLQSAALIKQVEGLSLSAYLDSAGVKTIGYGHVMHGDEQSPITHEVANLLLYSDMRPAFKAVINTMTPAPLTNNQTAALTCFVFNVGVKAYINSKLFKSLQSGDYAGAVVHWSKWVNVTVGGLKKPLTGLINRRAIEIALFLKD